jgi:hypothetical protein
MVEIIKINFQILWQIKAIITMTDNSRRMMKGHEKQAERAVKTATVAVVTLLTAKNLTKFSQKPVPAKHRLFHYPHQPLLFFA